MSAREAILQAIRAAQGPAPPTPEPLRPYRRSSGLSPDALRDRLAERLADYNVAVQRLPDDGAVGPAVEAILAQAGIDRVIVPYDLPDAWRPRDALVLEDADQALHDLDQAPAVLTGARCAVAETGSVILDSGRGQGRRAITLLPDIHLCVVLSSQIVGILPEALDQLAPDARRPLTFISGPSATADIEFSRVVGVHGPRTLHVLIVTNR
jgi:L-lactate dehydrogenase complex protein LldG